MHDTCPLCLGEGTFEIASDETSRNGEGTQMVRCKNQLGKDRYDDTHYEECDFTFLAKYLEMPKLCFPRWASPTSGKTHWLAMAYRELTRGNYPSMVQFAKVRSSAAVLFDKSSTKSSTSESTPEPPKPTAFPLRWSLISSIATIWGDRTYW